MLDGSLKAPSHGWLPGNAESGPRYRAMQDCWRQGLPHSVCRYRLLCRSGRPDVTLTHALNGAVIERHRYVVFNFKPAGRDNGLMRAAAAALADLTF